MDNNKYSIEPAPHVGRYDVRLRGVLVYSSISKRDCEHFVRGKEEAPPAHEAVRRHLAKKRMALQLAGAVEVTGEAVPA